MKWFALILLAAGCASADRSPPPVTEHEADVVIRNKEILYGPRYWERWAHESTTQSP